MKQKPKIKEEIERKENEKKWMMHADAVLMFSSEDLSPFGILNQSGYWSFFSFKDFNHCV